MKLRSLLTALALCSLPSVLCYSQQFALDYRAGTTGIFAQKTFSTAANRLLGTINGSDPVSITLGTGLSFSGTTLNATASGGTWGTITGTLSSQTDLQTALDAKLATATASTTYASLTGSYANPSWITSLAWSKISGISTSTGGNGATDAGKIVLFDAAGGLTADSLSIPGADTTVTLGNTGLQLADAASSGYLDLRATYIEFANSTGAHITTLLPALSGGLTNVRMPTTTGTLITTGDTGTVTNTMLAGSIANAKLANSSITINGSAISLGGSVTTASLAGNAFTASQTVTLTSLGTTPTAALSLINATAAAAGAQQVSPSLVLTGQGWKTNATAASQTVNYRAYVLPIQGTANPTSSFKLDFDNGAGAYTQGLTYTPGSLPLLSLGGTGASSGARIETDYNSGVGILLSAANSSLYQNGTSTACVNFGSGAAGSARPGISLGSSATAAVNWTGTATATSGTIDLALARVAAGILGLAGNATGASLEVTEMTAPGTPAADKARLYLEDNGSGKSRVVVKWSDGTTTVLATQP